MCDFNEKLFILYFLLLILDILVICYSKLVCEFYVKYKDVICKLLDGMGGVFIFWVKEDGINLGVIIEILIVNG